MNLNFVIKTPEPEPVEQPSDFAVAAVAVTTVITVICMFGFMAYEERQDAKLRKSKK